MSKVQCKNEINHCVLAIAQFFWSRVWYGVLGVSVVQYPRLRTGLGNVIILKQITVTK